MVLGNHSLRRHEDAGAARATDHLGKPARTGRLDDCGRRQGGRKGQVSHQSQAGNSLRDQRVRSRRNALPEQKGDETRWTAGDKVKQIAVELPRGVLIRGQVFEKATAKPVAGASIRFRPETANNKRASDDLLTGSPDQTSDTEGKLEIAVLSGPGNLIIHRARRQIRSAQSQANGICREGSPAEREDTPTHSCESILRKAPMQSN